MVLGPFRAGVVANSGERVRFCTLPWVKSPSSLIHSIYDLLS